MYLNSFSGNTPSVKMKKWAIEKKIDSLKIESIDLVIVNLYKYDEARKEFSSHDKIIENIDIGGPSLIRSAAKNFAFTTVVVDINDYDLLIEKLSSNEGIDLEYRKFLAAKAFNITAEYDRSISNWFNNNDEPKLPET